MGWKGELNMAKLTPQQIVDKQVKNAANAVGDYRTGVQNTDKNPMQLAVQSLGKMRNNFNAAIDSGKVAAGFNSVSLAQWKQQTAKKGGDRYVDGVNQAKSKMLAFQTQIAPFRDALQQQISQMPSDTLDQRIQRMVANANGMHQFKFVKPQMS
jgi:hypothetical protein